MKINGRDMRLLFLMELFIEIYRQLKEPRIEKTKTKTIVDNKVHIFKL
jgi:hypothetical protein